MKKIIKPQLGTVRYNLKESKETLKQSRKESPISLWFSYGKRQRLRYSIGISVGYADWDFERQRVRRNRSLIINSATVNRYLDKLQNELIRDHSELVLEGKEVNNEVLRSILDRLTNRNIESEVKVIQDDFFVFADEFIEEKRGSIENVTLLLYKQSLKKLESFSNSKTLIDLDKIEFPFNTPKIHKTILHNNSVLKLLLFIVIVIFIQFFVFLLVFSSCNESSMP